MFFQKGYGYEDVEKQTPVDPVQTLFRPGSVSKLFTLTSIMQLLEQGKLDLDADVNTYLKDFNVAATYPQPVTLRNIMTHTAGFEDGGVGYLFAGKAEDLLPLGKWLATHQPARARSCCAIQSTRYDAVENGGDIRSASAGSAFIR